MTVRPFLVSSPGKVILFGEHAVVYGKSAVAASIGLRAYLLFQPTQDHQVRIRFPDILLDQSFAQDDIPLLPVYEQHPSESEHHFSHLLAGFSDNARVAILAFLCLYSHIGFEYEQAHPNAPPKYGFTIHIKSFIPVGAGLGSSAAFSVCIATALLRHFDHSSLDNSSPGLPASTLSTINNWAFRMEQVTHGQPSGVDNTIAVYGGAKLYRKGQEVENLEGFSSMRFLLTNTRVPKNTKKMVANVAQFRNKYPAVVDPLLEAINGIAHSFKELVSGNPSQLNASLAELVTMNQSLLSVLGVSHQTLDTLCQVTSCQQLPSKLTGAGGGGCALTWVPPSTTPDTIAQVKRDLKTLGYITYDTDIGGPGVQACDISTDVQHATSIFLHSDSLCEPDTELLERLKWTSI
ncbi:Mevalonate kinase [Dispira parvispora]|uniref:Mevalonate kinase n=1 Tax=Dispira parvispora TaxID=1520584 RepID=A0A9W8AUN6_9FUNG|nr:Mevalonate kinase [Dispira parvispora]